jgi:RNA polymerase sigma-70 factor (ECF subfamily)
MRGARANSRNETPERADASPSGTLVPLAHSSAGPAVHSLNPAALEKLPSHPGLAGPLSPGESTVELTNRARGGDQAAFEALCLRCLKSLTRYAAGRLPPVVRDMLDTQDVVLEAVQRGMNKLDAFECRHPGALLAYLRTILRNLIIDHVRARRHQPQQVSLEDRHADRGLSPLERVLDGEQIELYEAALARLKPRDAALVTLRLEEHLGHDDIAAELGLPSSNTARVAVKRAVLRLAHEMSKLNHAKRATENVARTEDRS